MPDDGRVVVGIVAYAIWSHPMTTAADIMRKDVICVRATTTVEQAARILLDKRISGAPVVDNDGHLVGIISEYNLLAMVYDPKTKSAPVGSFASKDVVSVKVDTKLSDVADLLVIQRIRRVPVLFNGTVVGLISRPEMLRFALTADNGAETADSSASAQAAVTSSPCPS
jgi:CBS domain-containing protein